jgi:uncharacterized protein YqhQ
VPIKEIFLQDKHIGGICFMIFSTSSKKLKEYVILIAFLIFGILLLIASSYQPSFGESNQSPGVFPAVVAIIIIFTSSFMLIKYLVINFRAKRTKKSPSPSTEIEIEQKDQNGKLLVPLIIIILYALLIGHINFFVVTFLFLAALMFYLKAGKIKTIFIISLAVVISFKIVFELIFKVILP